MIYCFGNRKGGVGKTTVAGNTAFELSQSQTVLLIDADNQGSLTSWLCNKPPTSEFADVLLGKVDPFEACHQLAEKLFILPTFSDGDLRAYAERTAPSEPFAFADLTSRLGERFDHVLVDLPPGMQSFEQSILAACDRCLPVVQAEFLSVTGLRDLMADLERIRQKRRSGVKLNWIVVNAFNRSFRRHDIYRKALAENWQGYRLFEIPQSAKVSEAQTLNQPLGVYDPKEQRALPLFRDLAKALKEEFVYAKA